MKNRQRRQWPWRQNVAVQSSGRPQPHATGDTQVCVDWLRTQAISLCIVWNKTDLWKIRKRPIMKKKTANILHCLQIDVTSNQTVHIKESALFRAIARTTAFANFSREKWRQIKKWAISLPFTQDEVCNISEALRQRRGHEVCWNRYIFSFPRKL